jgi:glutaredoxin
MKKSATLYRMHTSEHICPFGLRSKDLLERQGFEVDDHKLSSREETDKFKAEHDVETTPQTFIDGKRIGGHDALREHFNMSPAEKTGTTYTPVLAIFAVAFLMALATNFANNDSISVIKGCIY